MNTCEFAVSCTLGFAAVGDTGAPLRYTQAAAAASACRFAEGGTAAAAAVIEHAPTLQRVCYRNLRGRIRATQLCRALPQLERLPDRPVPDLAVCLSRRIRTTEPRPALFRSAFLERDLPTPLLPLLRAASGSAAWLASGSCAASSEHPTSTAAS